MTPEEKDLLLDRYVAGQPMRADEEAQVHQLLRTDSDFRSEYQLRQTLLEAGEQQRRAAWAARSKVRPVPVPKSVFPMRWVAAASVVLVVALGLLWGLQRPVDTRPLTGIAPLFRQQDRQLGLAGNDSAAGMVVWIVTKAPQNQYEFSQPDTLRIFATDLAQWRNKTWRLTSLSEVRYQLRVANRTYLLEQGRTIGLPLEPTD